MGTGDGDGDGDGDCAAAAAADDDISFFDVVLLGLMAWLVCRICVSCKCMLSKNVNSSGYY